MTNARNQSDFALIDPIIDTSTFSFAADTYDIGVPQKRTDSLIFFYPPVAKESDKKQTPSFPIPKLLNIGRLFVNLGDYNTGLRVLNQAVLINKKDSVPSYVPYVYNNMGNIHFLIGQYSLAIHYYLQSVGSARHADTEIRNRVQSNITRAFSYLSKYPGGLYYLTLAEKSPLLPTDHPLRGHLMIQKSLLYLQKNEIALAEKELMIAVEWAKSNNDTATVRESAHMLVSLYTGSQQYSKAAASLKLLSADSSSLPLPEKLDILLSSGKLLFASRQYTQAVPLLEQIISTAHEPEMLSRKLEAHHALSQIYGQTGRYKEAYQHSQAHTDGIQKIKDQEITDNRNRIQAQYKITQKDKQIYQDQLLINQHQIAIDQKNEWLLFISSSILFLAIAGIGIYKNNRHKQIVDQMKAYMAGEEKERNRIARDLHDGIGGMLASLNMHMSALPSRHESLQTASDFSETVELLHETVREIRNTAHSLMPETLSHYGFEDAMRIFCRDTAQRSGVQITFHCLKYDDETMGNHQLSLYRILQELVQDTIKYAQPAQLLMHVNFYANTISVLIEDNGAETSQSPQRDLLYNSLRQRCKALNGTVNIESNKGKGASLHLQFNYHKKKIRLNEYFGSHS